MSLTELEFYKCKLCKEVDLVAGKYCIVCAKKDKVDKALKTKKSFSERNGLNTNRKSPGYPFIDVTLTPDYGYQDFTGTRAGSCTIGTTAVDQPIWTNFTAAGNATNTLDTSTFATVSSGSAMDLGFGSAFQIGQNTVSSKRKKTRHQ